MTKTQTTTHPVRWGSLCLNDIIVCPIDGKHERVTHTASWGTKSRAIRTTRHDHVRLVAEKVERVTR
jgi:hypothetical protein